MNALATMVASDHLGISAPDAAAALTQFQNVKRRMEVRGTAGSGITVYDDFCASPDGDLTTLDGLRPQGRCLLLHPRGVRAA